MTDPNLEREGEKVFADSQQLKQLDDMVNEGKPFVLTDLKGVVHTFVLETFSVYKTKEVLKILAEISQKVNIAQLIGEIQVLSTPIPAQKLNPDGTVGEWSEDEQEILTDLQANKVATAINALPKLFTFAPDTLLDFGALAIISNDELEAAYDRNGIEQIRKDKRKLLEFHFDSAAPLKLLTAYFPYVGINFMVQELGKMDAVAASLLQTASRPSTG